MGMNLFLVCEETKQQIPLGGYTTAGGPSSEASHGWVVKLFGLAHKGMDLAAKEGGGEGYICWDAPSSIELYERMTQHRVSDDFAAHVLQEHAAAGGADNGIWFKLERLDCLDPEKLREYRLGPPLRARADYLALAD